MNNMASTRRPNATSGVAFALLCAAGLAIGWLGWQLIALHEQGATFRVAGVCGSCGHVERVKELERGSPAALLLNGDRSESIVMMIAALGGRVPRPAAGLSFHTYETYVRLDDGSIRILRDSSEPSWKAGDRVRVVRGRVEPMTRQLSLGSGAPAS